MGGSNRSGERTQWSSTRFGSRHTDFLGGSMNWKKVRNWPYEVSDMGQVRSKARTVHDSIGRTRRLRPVVLKPGVCPSTGYKTVVLYRDGKKATFKVHQLVLRTFKPTKRQKVECRHKNGDRSDNRLLNLLWGTRSENVKDSVRHGTHSGSNHKTSVVRSDGKVYTSVKSAADDVGVRYPNISACCSGRQQTAGGYTWKYYERT